ncbi:alginate export family protein [Luteolibacter flavescens]|uniref:Alginate export family protein n=1 Tax=Luteolibacter flavescens TaxID=1859460 RepID=A0ABT3FUR7_9BACT|nr:alginate export family protein [Luteolibacter flavescens]MCW1887336.1 alginate export family protein [Luteolibacter flavescens]
MIALRISAIIPVLASLCHGGTKEEPRWSIDGHARTMYESYRGLDLGLGPVEDDDWVHQRVQAMFSWRPADSFQLGAELTWGHMWGRESPLGPPDEDDLDLLQLFATGRIPLGDDLLEIQAGRQTLYYGSGRLLASREGANQRLAHDALRVSWQRDEHHRVDAFIASPVAVEPGAFDNESRPGDIRFWSIYSVMPVGGGNFLDLYYIGLRDEDSIFAESGGHETRHTVGARWWRDSEPVLLNTELIFQFGEAAGRDIIAGAASLGTGYVFVGAPWRPSLQLRADAISGGDDTGTLHTFHPLFQANNYFNEGGFLSPSNLYNLNPLVSLKPRENVELTLGVNFQWRFSPDDAVYGPPLQRLGGPAPDGERYLGTAFNASVAWEVVQGTSVFVGYTHHDAGPSLRSVGGSSVDYFQASFRQEF